MLSQLGDGPTVTSRGRFFWTDDIHNMAHKLASYQKDAKMGKAGAKKVLEDFKIARKLVVEAILSVSSSFLFLFFITSTTSTSTCPNAKDGLGTLHTNEQEK
jgi:hypothetical protein